MGIQIRVEMTFGMQAVYTSKVQRMKHNGSNALIQHRLRKIRLCPESMPQHTGRRRWQFLQSKSQLKLSIDTAFS